MMTDIISTSPPTQKDSTYLLADYVELLCLLSSDGEISLGDAVNRVYKSISYEASLEAEIIDTPDGEFYPGKLSDDQLSSGEDWFRQLSYRQEAFGQFYPFCVKDHIIFLKFDLSISQALYIFLLACSKLGILNGSKRIQLTTEFERVSYQAFGKYLPSFTVHNFGKTPDGKKLYPSKLRDAIIRLSDHLNEKLIFDASDFPDKDTGDGGLDLVAFKMFGDNLSSNLICFAQCACGPENWMEKQSESSYGRWRNRIHFVHPPANFMFTPVCFRKNDGTWYKRDKIESSVLIDRLRICKILDGSLDDCLGLYQSVQIFLDYEEE